MPLQKVHALPSASVQVGQDGHGQWIVRDGRDRFGGIFRRRIDALRFAMAEGRTNAVLMMPGPLALPFRS